MKSFGRVAIAMLVAPLMLASCALIGVIVNKTHPPRKVPAAYKPPAGKTVLTLVETSLTDTDQPVARMLTERLNKRFEKERVAAKTIPYEALLGLLARTPEFNNMKPAEVGKNLNADLVCYVLVHKFELKSPDLGDLWRGNFEAAVSIVDVATGEELWPVSSREGHHVRPVAMPPTNDSSPRYGDELAGTLCDGMADRIAKLFYDHTIPIEEEDQDQQLQQDVWSGF